jgi:hypothetical protein
MACHQLVKFRTASFEERFLRLDWLHPNFGCRKQVISCFKAERQALAMMDHHNIAREVDGGATDNGRPFFVMELVRGVPITDYCDREN